MNKTTLIAGALTIFSFYSCSQQTGREQELVETETAGTEVAVLNAEAFESDTTYSFKLDTPSPDTLKRISHSWYFYYPFGKFSTPQELQSRYSNSFTFEEQLSPIGSDATEKVTLTD